MELGYIVAMVVLVIIIGFGFKKLMNSEVAKNDPNLGEPRDTNTDTGNQGTLSTRKNPD